MMYLWPPLYVLRDYCWEQVCSDAVLTRVESVSPGKLYEVLQHIVLLAACTTGS